MRPLAFILLLLASGCQSSQPPAAEVAGDAPGAAAPIASAPSDTNPVQRLEAEARALARTTGCGQAAQCRSAPVGDRPCGGPRDYLAYCATSTDTVALFRKLEELRRAEQEINQRSGAISTCEFRMPPQTELVGGSCRAKQASEAPTLDARPQ